MLVKYERNLLGADLKNYSKVKWYFRCVVRLSVTHYSFTIAWRNWACPVICIWLRVQFLIWYLLFNLTYLVVPVSLRIHNTSIGNLLCCCRHYKLSVNTALLDGDVEKCQVFASVGNVFSHVKISFMITLSVADFISSLCWLACSVSRQNDIVVWLTILSVLLIVSPYRNGRVLWCRISMLWFQAKDSFLPMRWSRWIGLDCDRVRCFKKRIRFYRTYNEYHSCRNQKFRIFVLWI